MINQKETNRILAERLLKPFDSKRLVEWAVKLLMNGNESESLIILAGLDYDSTEEREKYFWKSIEELKIDHYKSEIELIDKYAIIVAKDVLESKINAFDGLNIMGSILRKTDYASKYIDFLRVEEDLDFIEDYDRPINIFGLTNENREQYIKEEFELFIEVENLSIDDETREKSICNRCGMISRPNLKRKYQLKKPYKYHQWECGICGSKDIEHFSSHSGRRKIIERIQNRT